MGMCGVVVFGPVTPYQQRCEYNRHVIERDIQSLISNRAVGLATDFGRFSTLECASGSLRSAARRSASSMGQCTCACSFCLRIRSGVGVVVVVASERRQPDQCELSALSAVEGISFVCRSETKLLANGRHAWC
ncbi:hypothetical protein SARC_09907 [Sphaeroforma arctica JP610]|uniref:Uncharacterized protein n=1 Tax=Sphaeroforma arctica JP610 TaxID=667725 RepID=A0A0L0FLK7_9EUKA|nr:hypothetical protein SARC_09907 [Sphaeroforma arctica JP610]KNC77635.1 hypothetical protein SARC_09907 [Sphaeroforma arctica JP610]|eukprot:XP_014151537.1 hypothetical protein SARC_09907 [Sphaeroforma arctica JP610]